MVGGRDRAAGGGGWSRAHETTASPAAKASHSQAGRRERPRGLSSFCGSTPLAIEPVPPFYPCPLISTSSSSGSRGGLARKYSLIS